MDNLLEAQEKLAKIINNSPHLASLGGTDYAVTYLKNGTQYLICEEAVKIVKKENATMGDVMMMFSENMPSIAKVVTLALLNDKGRIYRDGDASNGFSDEYDAVYDTIMWKADGESIVNLLFEVLSMLDVSFFLTSSEAIKTMRDVLTRKTPQQR